MQVSEIGWAVLGGSLLAAVLVDFVLLRVLLEVFRPPSVTIPWAGRAAKLTTLVLWIYFFNSFWYPQYLAPGRALSDVVRNGEIAVVVVLVLLAIVTLPRSGSAAKDGDD